MKSITWDEFLEEFSSIKKSNNSYRLGQAFINKFIKDESDKVLEGLWEKDWFDAVVQITEIIDEYQWDYNNLIVVNEGERK
jgi:hypothetical protein